MRTSHRLRQFIKGKEALALKAYPDPKTGGAPWTIGYGCTKGVNPGDTCTLAEAEQWFDEDIEHFETLANNAITVPVTQGQFDAFVSLLYNVGPGSKTRDGIIRLKNGMPSTLLRRLNERNYDLARAEFVKWRSPGSSVERGLKIRREQEVKEFWDVPDTI